MEGPRTPHSSEIKGAAEADIAEQKRCGIKGRHLTAAHLALPQLQAIVAGEIAGARGRLGGIGAKLTNMADVPKVELRRNQGTVAKLVEEQDRKWRQLARGRQDVRRVESKLRQPNQSLVARVLEDRQEEFKARLAKNKDGDPYYKNNEQPKEGESGYSWGPGGGSRFYQGEESERGRGCGDLRKQRSRAEGYEDDRRSPRCRKRGDQPLSKRTKKDEDSEAK